MTSLQFQILSASAKDVRGSYAITLFGATAAGDSVSVTIMGFRPYFYVQLPDTWADKHISAYKRYLQDKLVAALLKKTTTVDNKTAQRTKERVERAIQFDVQSHKSFWDFTAERSFRYLRIQALSKRMFMMVRDICQDRETCAPIPVPRASIANGGVGTVTLRVFEANIDPMLRFFHEREIKPAAWVEIGEDHFTPLDELEDDGEGLSTTAKIQGIVDYDRIQPAATAVQLTAAPLPLFARKSA